MKMCSRCKLEKTETAFGLRRGALRGWCKACERAHSNGPHPKYPGWSRSRATHIWSKFRIRPDVWEQMWRDQQGLCGACFKSMTQARQGLGVGGKQRATDAVLDHCQTLKQPRKLVHDLCNRLIGHWELHAVEQYATQRYVARYVGALARGEYPQQEVAP